MIKQLSDIAKQVQEDNNRIIEQFSDIRTNLNSRKESLNKINSLLAYRDGYDYEIQQSILDIQDQLREIRAERQLVGTELTKIDQLENLIVKLDDQLLQFAIRNQEKLKQTESITLRQRRQAKDKENTDNQLKKVKVCDD
ncbi:hypothetical protein pb186bvf_012826 [Paramecium bursaria]